MAFTIGKGRAALVTGGGSGIGRAISLALAKEGVNVVIGDANEAAAAGVVGEIEALGGKGAYALGDVSKKEVCAGYVEKATEQWGRLDILVTCAGFVRDNLLFRMTEEEWDNIIDVHLKGTFLCIQAAAPVMKKNSFGRIVTISSVNHLGNAGQANYSAAKAGIIGLTKTAAIENLKYGITANVIAPGVISTGARARAANPLSDEAIQRLYDAIPMKRAGIPEEVAHAALSFIAEEAGYTTGQVLHVDGGLTTGAFRR